MKKLIILTLILILSSTALASENTWMGPTGLFTVYSARNLACGEFSGSLYFNNFDREFAWYEGATTEDGDQLSIDYSYISVPLAYGITDRFELSLSPHYNFFRRQYIEDVDGFGDLFVHLKTQLIYSEDNGGLAAVITGKIPTADEDEGLGTGEFDYGLTLVGTKEIGKTDLHLNLGYHIIGAVTLHVTV